MGLYLLVASDCSGPDCWHWSLYDVDADGRRNRLLTEHPVSLDRGEWQYLAWLDLHGFVRTYAAPDRRREDERRIADDVGQWIGDRVFGPIGAKLAKWPRTNPSPSM